MTIVGVNKSSPNNNNNMGFVTTLVISLAFGGITSVLVYCTRNISGGYINPAVTYSMLWAGKLTETRADFYVLMQFLGAICGACLVKWFESSQNQVLMSGVANVVNHGYTEGVGFGAEIVGTFVLVYTALSTIDTKRNSHFPILAPLPVGFAVFLVHLATTHITGTGINPVKSVATTIIFGSSSNAATATTTIWVFVFGPYIGAGLAVMMYHLIAIKKWQAA